MRDLRISYEDGTLYIEDTHVLSNGTVDPLLYLFCLLLEPSEEAEIFYDIIVKEKL